MPKFLSLLRTFVVESLDSKLLLAQELKCLHEKLLTRSLEFLKFDFGDQTSTKLQVDVFTKTQVVCKLNYFYKPNILL